MFVEGSSPFDIKLKKCIDKGGHDGFGALVERVDIAQWGVFVMAPDNVRVRTTSS
jgi:hypothetical protein